MTPPNWPSQQGAEGPGLGAKWKLDAEWHGAVFKEVVAVVGGAHGALERGEEEGEGLLVVPDVCTAAFAAAFVGV